MKLSPKCPCKHEKAIIIVTIKAVGEHQGLGVGEVIRKVVFLPVSEEQKAIFTCEYFGGRFNKSSPPVLFFFFLSGGQLMHTDSTF